MGVSLRPVTSANWVECIGLEPTEKQRQAMFVSPNVLSLAQAYAERWWVPLAIYAGEVMVGFVMYGRWPDEPLSAEWGPRQPGIHHILRLMVDQRYQGHGYARAALKVLIERVRAEPDARALETNYDLDNMAADHLYTRLGFRPTGIIDDDEIRVRLELKL